MQKPTPPFAGSDGTRNTLCAEGIIIPIKVVRFRIFSFLLQTFLFFFNFLQEYKLQTFEAKTAILFLRLKGHTWVCSWWEKTPGTGLGVLVLFVTWGSKFKYLSEQGSLLRAYAPAS